MLRGAALPGILEQIKSDGISTVLSANLPFGGAISSFLRLLTSEGSLLATCGQVDEDTIIGGIAADIWAIYEKAAGPDLSRIVLECQVYNSGIIIASLSSLCRTMYCILLESRRFYYVFVRRVLFRLACSVPRSARSIVLLETTSPNLSLGRGPQNRAGAITTYLFRGLTAHTWNSCFFSSLRVLTANVHLSSPINRGAGPRVGVAFGSESGDLCGLHLNWFLFACVEILPNMLSARIHAPPPRKHTTPCRRSHGRRAPRQAQVVVHVAPEEGAVMPGHPSFAHDRLHAVSPRVVRVQDEVTRWLHRPHPPKKQLTHAQPRLAWHVSLPHGWVQILHPPPSPRERGR